MVKKVACAATVSAGVALFGARVGRSAGTNIASCGDVSCGGVGVVDGVDGVDGGGVPCGVSSPVSARDNITVGTVGTDNNDPVVGDVGDCGEETTGVAAPLSTLRSE